MTPEEEKDLDTFEAALRGEGEKRGAAGRLGEVLRKRRAEALASRDEAQQMRVWKAIDTRIAAETKSVPASAWQRMRFAQAAAVFAIGIGAGWFLRPEGTAPLSDSRLEFAYGDFETPRGGIVDKTIPATAPKESLRTLTDALIADTVPFELYSVGADRRVVFAVPSGEGSRTVQVLSQLEIAAATGETLSLTFAGPPAH